MTTKTHAELEKYHYQALSNRDYQLEGMLDCLREELYNNHPYAKVEEMPIEQVVIQRHSNMSEMESNLLQQTARKVEHVSKTFKEHLNVKKSTIKGLYDSVETQ